jgi:hypothetical protein
MVRAVALETDAHGQIALFVGRDGTHARCLGWLKPDAFKGASPKDRKRWETHVRCGDPYAVLPQPMLDAEAVCDACSGAPQGVLGDRALRCSHRRCDALVWVWHAVAFSKKAVLYRCRHGHFTLSPQT